MAEDHAVALEVKAALKVCPKRIQEEEDLRKRIQEDIPVVKILNKPLLFAHEIEDRTVQGLELVAQSVGSQDDNHKHRWNRRADANHYDGRSGSGSSAVPETATVVAESGCPPPKPPPRLASQAAVW